jgi:hypothetical protein
VICNGGQPLGPKPLPPNFLLAPADAYTPDLVAAGDCVIGKIGYGWAGSSRLAFTPPIRARASHRKEGNTWQEEPLCSGNMHVCGWCECPASPHKRPARAPHPLLSRSTMSECLAHTKPLVFVRRDFFNEEPFLRKVALALAYLLGPIRCMAVACIQPRFNAFDAKAGNAGPVLLEQGLLSLPHSTHWSVPQVPPCLC